MLGTGKYVSGNDSRLQIPSPPNDLLICITTRRHYWQNGAQKRGQLKNAYFHCMAYYVRLMQPAFIPFLVYILYAFLFKTSTRSTLQGSRKYP